TINFRFEQTDRALGMIADTPYLGVGLGNYYDHLRNGQTTRLSLLDWRNKETEIASRNPHTILAQLLVESGAIGLVYFAAMLLWFAIADVRQMLTNNLLKKAYIISFWSLFSYSLFNPTTTLSYVSLFFLLR